MTTGDPTRQSYRNALDVILTDRPIAYHRCLVGVAGSVKAALFLSQLLYWQGRGRFGSWTYKTCVDWERETGLTRREQETARGHLRDAGIIEEERRGIPALLFFRIDLDRLSDLLADAPYTVPDDTSDDVKPSMAEPAILDSTNPPFLIRQNRHTGVAEPAIQEWRNPPIYYRNRDYYRDYYRD